MVRRRKQELSDGDLNAAIAYAKGVPAKTALKHAGYPESMRTHCSKQVLHSQRMQAAFKQLGLTLAADLGGPEYAERVSVLQDPMPTYEQKIKTVCELYKEYAKKPDKKENPSEAIMELPDISRVLLWNDVEEVNGLALIKSAEDDEDVPPGLLARISKRAILKNLLNPKTDARSMATFARLALEVDGAIGEKNETHLHVHNVPPILQQMFDATLRKLRDQDEREKALLPVAEVVGPSAKDGTEGDAKIN